MADITLTTAVRSNLLSLQNTAELLGRTQERLATGNKVNSALDDPTAFFTASALESRSRDLNRLLDSAGLGIQTLKAADTGISALTDLVEQAQATARQALQTAGPVTTSTVAGAATATFNPAGANTVTGTAGTIQAVVDGTVDVDTLALDVSAAATININGTSIDLETADSNGDSNNTLTQAELIAEINLTTGTHNVTASDGGGGTVTLTAAQGSDIALTDGTATPLVGLGFAVGTTTSQTSSLLIQSATNDFNQGDTLSIQIGSTTKTITIGTGGSEVDTLTELNNELGTLTNGSASVDANGNVTITSTNVTDAITISGSFGGNGNLADFGLTAGEFTNLVSGTTGIVDQGDTLTLQVGSATALTVTFGTGGSEVNTLAELQTALNGLTGGTATVDTTTGAISVAATDTSESVTISEGSGGEAAAFGLTTGVFASVTTNSTTRTSLESQFNEVIAQIDLLARDSSFNGNNLLQSDNLTLILNEDGTSTISIQGVDFDSGGLGINGVAADSFQTNANIDTTLAELDTAVGTLRSQASTFGSNLSIVQTREQFTKELSNVLETGAANLTLADLNEEGANLLALQTRQQLSTVALSLASQADQQVLRLF